MTIGGRLMVICLLLSVIAHFLLAIFLLRSDGAPSENVSVRLEFAKSSSRVDARPNRHERSLQKAKSTVHPASNSGQDNLQEGFSVLGHEFGIPVNYPKLSRVLGEEGEVKIEVTKKSDGHYQAKLKAPSSGFERLDQAALSAVEDSMNSSAIQHRLAQHRQIEIKFIFRLTQGED